MATPRQLDAPSAELNLNIAKQAGGLTLPFDAFLTLCHVTRKQHLLSPPPAAAALRYNISALRAHRFRCTQTPPQGRR